MKIVSSLACLLTLAASASAVEVLPLSYSFDMATDSGTYNYSDWGGAQLTDGQYGVAPWSANLGSGPAYEWVGWRNDSLVNIDFVMSAASLITGINIGTVQDHVNDVVIPDVFLYSSSDGSSWSFIDSIITPESSTNNHSYKTLSFAGLSITDDYIRVALAHNTNGPWTFVDEVDFVSEREAQGVPDSGSTLALLGAAFLGLIGFRKRVSA